MDGKLLSIMQHKYLEKKNGTSFLGVKGYFRTLSVPCLHSAEQQEHK
jgi:hypothetical protein